MSFQDGAFLPFRVSFHTTFLGRSEHFRTFTGLRTVVGDKYWHAV